MYRSGDRVEIDPATDTWMQGDRYGTVIQATDTLTWVRMDKSGDILRFGPLYVPTPA